MATINSVNNQLGPNSSLLMSAAGAMTLAQQPCFLAYLSTTAGNVTGDGSSYKIPFDIVLFDKTNSYDPDNGNFICPQTGIYQFDGCVNLAAGNISTATYFQIKVDTDDHVFYPVQINPNVATISAGLSMPFSLKAHMNYADIANVTVTVGGLLTATVGIGGSNSLITYFSGALIN